MFALLTRVSGEGAFFIFGCKWFHGCATLVLFLLLMCGGRGVPEMWHASHATAVLENRKLPARVLALKCGNAEDFLGILFVFRRRPHQLECGRGREGATN